MSVKVSFGCRRMKEVEASKVIKDGVDQWQKLGLLPTPSLPISIEPTAPRARTMINGEGEVRNGAEQRILNAIRWWNMIGVATPSHPQVAFVAGYSHKSGTWSTYLSRLRSSGLIEGRGDLVLTEAGARVATTPQQVPTGDQLRNMVLEKIDAPLRRIMAPIMGAYPGGLTHQAAAEAAVYSPTSGTWSTYLSRLRSLDLIEGRGELKAQAWLFPGV